MKFFYLALILIFNFQFLTNAEEVKNFEIEGMTVGESLLNYMKKSEIEDKINSNASYHYPNGSYVVFGYYSDEMKIYDDVGVVIKLKDPNYKIYALEGTIYFQNGTCNEKQKEISSDLKRVLDSSKYNYTESFNQNFSYDNTGASKVSYLDFNFNDKSAIRVICWVLSEEFKSTSNNIDRLVVAANSVKFMKWINKNMIAE
jgi:hypothetical protein